MRRYENQKTFVLRLQQRLDEIIESWTRHRRTITIRLRIADDLNRLLRLIREDEYYHQAVNSRLKSIASVDMRVSQQLRESEMIRIHTDMLEVQSRLESQQPALQHALDEVRAPLFFYP